MSRGADDGGCGSQLPSWIEQLTGDLASCGRRRPLGERRSAPLSVLA